MEEKREGEREGQKKKNNNRELYFPGRTRSSILLKIICDERQNIKLRQKTCYKEYNIVHIVVQKNSGFILKLVENY